MSPRSIAGMRETKAKTMQWRAVLARPGLRKICAISKNRNAPKMSPTGKWTIGGWSGWV
ncbi:MAG: hypothetical protein JRJ00_12965 [Deltaproteobacteria bacterium]|nr:hypothetical protein [Deltaproteobacteria bacterium]